MIVWLHPGNQMLCNRWHVDREDGLDSLTPHVAHSLPSTSMFQANGDVIAPGGTNTLNNDNDSVNDYQSASTLSNVNDHN